MPLNRPASLSVRVLTNELVEVYDWEKLGLNLGIKKYKLREIKKNRSDELSLCKLDLFDLWLRSDITASWQKMIGAVKQLGEYEELVVSLSETYLGIKTTVHHSSTGASVVTTSKGGGTLGGIQVVSPPAKVASTSAMEVDHTPFYRALEVMNGPVQEMGGEGKVIQMVKAVINENLDVNMINKDHEYRQSFLQLAAQNGDISIVKVLVAFGAKVDYINAKGMTAMDSASLTNQRAVVELLRRVGGHTEKEISKSKHAKKKIDRVEEDQEMDTRQSETHHVLTLDSSAEMALVQLEVLNQIEEVTGKKIKDMFEWIVASGIGGFLLLAMIYNNKSIEELRRLYFQLWERLFQVKDPNGKMKELERYAVEVFGSSLRMSEKQESKVLIGAVNKETTQLKLHFFNNFTDDDSSRTHVWKVACYTCATRDYFGEVDNFIDGGAICRNLSDAALTFIEEQRTITKYPPVTGVVSIGDGIWPARPFAEDHNFHFCTANALAEQIHENCKCRCATRSGARVFYHRFNPLLPKDTPEVLHLESLIDLLVMTIVSFKEESEGSSNSELLSLAVDVNNF